MPRHERSGTLSTRTNKFQVANQHTTHKSWHRKDTTGSASLRRFALTNVYKYKKSNDANTVTHTSPAIHTKPTLPSTIKPKQTPPPNPEPSTFISSYVKEKDRICTNIHVNPLFTAGKSHEQTLKSWQKKLSYEPSTYLGQLNAPQNASAYTKTSPSGDLQPIAAHSFHSRSTIITNSFTRNSVGGSKENGVVKVTRDPSTNLDSVENRPSIHVNPSVLVSSAAKFPDDVLKRSNIVQLCETYRTQHNVPNKTLASVHVHGTGSAAPSVTESQRLVHVNPAILASNMAAKQSANAKTSVHVNPEVYARLKSEVRKERPETQQAVAMPTTSKLVTAGSSNKSLITISRTKLVRRGLPRSRKLSYRRSQLLTYSTPKAKKLTVARTPASAVVKVAKSVCSKYKFIRKSSQFIPNSTSPGATNKTFSFVRTTFKLDRRSQKTPKLLKKVKPYSVRYDNVKRHLTESNLQGIMVHKRLSTPRNNARGSRVWKNPGTLEPKKVVITNRKLFRIGNSPSVKNETNKSSTHKTLVRLGGVLYKTSRMKLTRTRTPRSISLGYKVEPRQSFMRKSSNRNRVLHVRGDKFLMDRSGRTLKRISSKPERSGVLKRIDIGGVTFIQKSKNVLIRTNTHNARNVVSQAKNKSIALLTMRLQKNNTHCRFYRRLGKCIGKEKGRCPCVHDPKYITICKKLLLTGECNVDGCLLSHEMIPEKMAICKFFMQGCCSRDACAYLHVRCDPDAPICVSFLQGYCADGSNCRKRHLYVCPQFDKTGKCPKSKYCPYPHKSKENLTVNLDHMHRCVGDIQEVGLPSNRDEPRTEEFRYFRFKPSSDLNLNSQTGNEQGVFGEGLEAEFGLLGTGEQTEDKEIEIDLNTMEEVVKRRRLFDEFFSLVHSDLTETHSPWDSIASKIKTEDGTQDSFNVPIKRELTGVDEDTLSQIQTDRETEFQMTFVDRLLRQNRCDFMPVDDDEWEKIECSQRTTRKHREEIGRLLIKRSKDRQLKSNASARENTSAVIKDDDTKLVTGEWINHILQQCEIIRVELEASIPKKVGNCVVEGGHGKSTMVVLSTLTSIKKVSKLLSDLVNTPGNKLDSDEINQIGKGSSCNFYRVSSSLLILLQGLLSNFHTKHIFQRNVSEHHCGLSCESSSTCMNQVRDVGNNIAPCSLCHFDKFPRPEGEENQNFTSRRPRIGTIPYFIPLN